MADHIDNPLDALAGVHASQARLAARAGDCPPWRHALFGMLYFILVGGIAMSGTGQIVASVIVLAAAAFIARDDRRRRGLLITGLRRDRTLPVTLGFLSVLVALVFAAMHMREHDFTNASKIGLAVIAFAAGTAFSMARQRVFRRQLMDHGA